MIERFHTKENAKIALSITNIFVMEIIFLATLMMGYLNYFFYYSNGYSSDSVSYRNSSSPYSSFDDSGITYSSDNSYNSYSGSIRQSSIASRQSSGGGLSGGK